MQFKRSMLGTVLFVLLAIIHLPAFWIIFDVLRSYEEMDYLELIAQLFQVLIFALYITLIFVKLKVRWVRYLVASVFAVCLVYNLTVAVTEFQYYSEIGLKLVALLLVVVDILVVVALCLPPTKPISKLTPFYAIADGEENLDEV